MSERFDIAVAGGGPAGLAAALALAGSGARAILIAPQARDALESGDHRTAALFAGSIELLKNLGAWEGCKAGSEPIAGIRLIDDTGSLFRAPEVTFTAQDAGLDVFGYNVPNASLTRALHSTLLAREDQIALRFGSSVTAVAIEPDCARLTLSCGAVIEASLIAAADGRHSLCRQAAKIATRTWSYPQSAVICTFQHGRAHQNISTEFHRPNGPLTAVPLPGRRSSLVWVESPQQANRLMALDDQAFAAELEENLQGLLGTIGSITGRAQFPLSGLSAETLAGNRVALIGEAAHVIPPIGAQGLNLGMRDAATLAQCVQDFRPSDAPAGYGSLTEAYAAARSGDVTSRIYAIDVLNRSLLAGMLPIHLMRGLGIYALGTFASLRRYVVREGLQPSTATPALMRPVGGAGRTSA